MPLNRVWIALFVSVLQRTPALASAPIRVDSNGYAAALRDPSRIEEVSLVYSVDLLAPKVQFSTLHVYFVRAFSTLALFPQT